MDPAGFNVEGFPWLGLALAVVANVILGFLWYAPWSPTGKVWMRETKTDPNAKPPGAQMAVSMGLMLLGALLMMFVFTHTMTVYKDAFQNTATGGRAGYDLTAMDGAFGGLMTWLGFIVPLSFNRISFERGSWSLFWVNSGYYLVSLVVAGVLVATVGGA